MSATLDLCPVNANTAQNRCFFKYSHLEEVLGLSLVMELVHLKDTNSHLHAERNTPSLLQGSVVPLRQCAFLYVTCVSSIFPLFAFLRCVKGLICSVPVGRMGLWSSHIMLYEAQSLPGSLLNAQEIPVVLR